MRLLGRLGVRLTAFCAAAAGVWAQSHVVAPHVGTMVDTSGALRPVSGMAGSFMAGSAHASGVVALACAETFCVAKTDAGLLTTNGQFAAPPGAAVLATDGKRSVAWFAQTGEFLMWSAGGRAPDLKPLAWNASGEVLSIRLTQDGAEIAVRRDLSVWIVTNEGAVRDTLPAEASGAVLLLDDGMVYTARADGTGSEIVFRRGSGSEVRFAVPDAPLALFRMGADWVEIVSTGATYALRTTTGRERVYLLPGELLPGDSP